MEEIEVSKEGRKKRGKRVAKRKLKKRSEGDLSMMTSIARDLTVDKEPMGLGVPTITVEETKSQPGSRRASVFDMINLSTELGRRDSEVVTELEVVKNERWKAAVRRKEDVETSGRRGSGKRGSLAEDDPEVAAKKLRSILDVMANPSRLAQQSFTWDSVRKEEVAPEEAKKKAPQG